MAETAHPLPKVPTGIPGLDHLTDGGLPEGVSTLVAGATGTGKTVLGTQFLAAGVTQHGQPGVYVTLEEPPAKVRRGVAGFGWDVAAWERKGTWRFVDASPHVGEVEIVVGDDLDFTPLLARIAEAVEQIGARRLAVDSLAAVFGRFGSQATVRRGMRDLIAGLERLGVTAVLTAERHADYDGISTYGVEEFVADNVILLRNHLAVERRRRTVEVLKLRGTSHRKGEHPFTIADDGISIFPLSVLALQQHGSEERVSTGNAELDRMCGGGLLRSSVTLVSGATGTGKSLCGLQFVSAGAAAGERGLLVALEESEAQLQRNARGWGIGLEDALTDGRVRLIAQYPESGSVQDLLLQIKRAIDEHQPSRLVVDSLTSLARIGTPDTIHEFLLGLSAFTQDAHITLMFSATSPSLLGESTATGAEASTVVDCIFLLRYVEAYGEVRRGLVVLKIRGSEHERVIREYTLGSGGMRIGAPLRTTTGILSGAALQLTGAEQDRIRGSFPEDAEPGGG
jgi:circadian clock protein KaiC